MISVASTYFCGNSLAATDPILPVGTWSNWGGIKPIEPLGRASWNWIQFGFTYNNPNQPMLANPSVTTESAGLVPFPASFWIQITRDWLRISVEIQFVDLSLSKRSDFPEGLPEPLLSGWARTMQQQHDWRKENGKPPHIDSAHSFGRGGGSCRGEPPPSALANSPSRVVPPGIFCLRMGKQRGAHSVQPKTPPLFTHSPGGSAYPPTGEAQ